jgi:hypothetical protein
MKKYLKYLIELIVIVVGITLSFMVDEWREERQKREDVERSLHLMLSNLESDSIQLKLLYDFTVRQEVRLKYLLTNNKPIHDSLLLDMFDASWSIRSQITIQNSGIENLNNIQGVKFQTKNFQEQLDIYYDNASLFNELIDWHLTNRRIDDYKWRLLKKYKELVIIKYQDPNNEAQIQLENNESLKSDLRDYFNDQQLLNLLADKFMMVNGVMSVVEGEMEENEILKKAIITELQQ